VTGGREPGSGRNGEEEAGTPGEAERASPRVAPGRADPGRAAAWLRERIDGPIPRVAVALGSGLGGLADRIEDAEEVPYGRIPGWPASGVVGHAGTLLRGTLGGVPVLGLSGRVHLYEGHPPARVVFSIRVLRELGVELFFVSNAAGAVSRRFAPGELMLIADHIDLTFRSPLAGPVVGGESRWPDLHGCYDPALRALVREVAREEGILLRDGVYAAMLGPSYETPAEIRMLERLGADAVGMSTVPEVVAARAGGIRCVGVSCLTNYAAGLAGSLDHAEVLETTERVAGDFERLVTLSVRRAADATGGGGGG